MALPFNTFSNEGVPDGTIRPTHDIYIQDNGNSVAINTNKGVFGGDFVRVINQNLGPRVIFSKTPIGAWSVIKDDKKLTRNFHSTPEKLTDEIATNCAGGSSLDYDELLRYDDGGVDTSCSIVTEDRFNRPVPFEYSLSSNTAETQGGVHYPTLCQMGDYVSTVSECETQCEGISPNPKGVGDNYCHFAKNRLCGKLKGDPIKKNSTGSDIINSDKDWITDQMCVDYCGGPDADDTDPTCLEKKNKYCANPDDWYSISNINEDLNMTKAEYCKTFWKKNFNNGAANKGCSSNLTKNYNKQRNIVSDKGCGILCPTNGKNQVNEDFCERMKIEFCEFNAFNTAPKEDTGLYFDFCKGKSEDEKKKDQTLLVIIVVSVCLVFFVVLVFAFRKLGKRSEYSPMSRPLLIGGRNNGYNQIRKFLHSLLYKKPCKLINL